MVLVGLVLRLVELVGLLPVVLRLVLLVELVLLPVVLLVELVLLPVVLQLVELVHLTMEFLVEKEVQVEEE